MFLSSNAMPMMLVHGPTLSNKALSKGSFPACAAQLLTEVENIYGLLIMSQNLSG